MNRSTLKSSISSTLTERNNLLSNDECFKTWTFHLIGSQLRTELSLLP